MFNFNPQTEDMLAKASLLEKGEYSFEVQSAIQKVSRSGNSMIELILGVWDIDGRVHQVYDYLMESMAYKIRHFCYSVGLGEKYELGGFRDSECLGKSGKCKIIIQEDKTGQYRPKNSVQDYLQLDAVDKNYKVETTPALDAMDDNIPF